MKLILIVDADNTLWDTDAVFARAQLAMLDALERRGHQFPVGDRLAFLRHVDRRVFEHFGRFEYDFTLLPLALVAAGRDRELRFDPASLTEMRSMDSEEAYAAFSRVLQEAVPPLLPGAEDLFAWLRATPVTGRQVFSVLLSEGNEPRLRRIAEAHQVDTGVFDALEILGNKNAGAFARLIEDGRAHLGSVSAICASVGDSMTRDIIPAKAAGCVTIYKPHHFHGDESGDDAARPDYRVKSLSEAVQILQRILDRPDDAP